MDYAMPMSVTVLVAISRILRRIAKSIMRLSDNLNWYIHERSVNKFSVPRDIWKP